MNTYLSLPPFQDFWIKAFGNSLAEWIGAITALIGIWLTTKGKISCWIFNIISSALYAYVFFKVPLYADFLLQFAFIGLSIYGWVNWVEVKSISPSKTRHIQKSEIGIGFLLLLVLTYLLGYLLKKYTLDSYPYIDAFCFLTSIWATYLTTIFVLENWLIWVFTNAVYIIIYIKKDLWPTSFLYGILLILAIAGYFEWRKYLIPRGQKESF